MWRPFFFFSKDPISINNGRLDTKNYIGENMTDLKYGFPTLSDFKTGRILGMKYCNLLWTSETSFTPLVIDYINIHKFFNFGNVP